MRQRWLTPAIYSISSWVYLPFPFLLIKHDGHTGIPSSMRQPCLANFSAAFRLCCSLIYVRALAEIEPRSLQYLQSSTNDWPKPVEVLRTCYPNSSGVALRHLLMLVFAPGSRKRFTRPSPLAPRSGRFNPLAVRPHGLCISDSKKSANRVPPKSRATPNKPRILPRPVTVLRWCSSHNVTHATDQVIRRLAHEKI
jgi:hypothetical protein